MVVMKMSIIIENSNSLYLWIVDYILDNILNILYGYII